MKTRCYFKRIGVVLAAALACLAMTATTAVAQQDSIKVGFVYVSPVGDAGWSYQHDLARKYMEEKLGDKVETIYVENVPEAGSERVIRQLAASGAELIFTTSFGYMNPTMQVAKRFPDVAFMHATGYKSADNVGNYMARLYEGRYLAGMVAGLMTETNKLGFVGAVPIPEVIRAIDAFTRGARAVNPEATVSVIWINAWYDPAKARQAANTLLDQGVDVITHHTDSHAVVQAAAERGKFAIGYHSDFSEYGGKHQLTAVVHHWGPFYTKMAKQVLNGTWEPIEVWYGIKHGFVDLAPFSPLVPDTVKQRVLEAKQKIVSGELHPFAGPVITKKGEVIVPEGEVMSDAAMLKMDFYVRGVASKLPN